MSANGLQSYDLVIRNTAIIDGRGTARFTGAIAVAGDRIAAVGELSGPAARQDIDGQGLVAAPGFIDVHTHDDNALLVEGAMMPKVTQGVTTVVVGNCGVSLAPLRLSTAPPPPLDLLGGQDSFRFASAREYVEALEERRPPVNAAFMIGHSSLRVATMKDIDRPATGGEIAAMCGLLREGLDSGAIGFSTGLFYPTNRAAPPQEVVALLEPLKGTGAIYATHMRDEGNGVMASLEETFDTAAQAGVPVVVSHHKCMGKSNFGRSQETLAFIRTAQGKQPIGLDVYPYTAGSTSLLAELVPHASRVIITWSAPHPEMAGRALKDIEMAWKLTTTDAIQRLKPAGAVYFMMDEADVERIMAFAPSMIGSDGLPHDRHPHPRLWGTFPRVLGHFVRERRLFSLETAVHKMTGLSATQFGLVDRGVIRKGAYADLVLFDPDRIADRATFEDPTLQAEGIELVMINGETVMKSGRLTGARPGQVLRREQPATSLR